MDPTASISDTLWDVVICGTGLQQSLLALSLSRSGKKVLHVDPNQYYGGKEAALSLQEVDDWLAALNPTLPSDSMAETVFSAAEVVKEKDTGARTLSFPRAYSLALAPQIIHNRSKLLSQLVSSRSYRQVEFMAVGSFHILKPPKPAAKREQQTEIDTPGPVSSQSGRLSFARIPSTREDIFSTTTIPAKTKRALVKFLKFVAEHESEAQRAIWEPFADTPLQEFLRTESKLDDEARLYIITLTLSLDGHIGTRDGLAALYRHLSSMGMLGPGFAAVYPKWGGLSEIAQVACRAGAVGGGVYILGTGVKEVQRTADDERQLRLLLSDDVVVQTRFLVGAAASPNSETPLTKVSRLVTVVGSPLPSLFEPPVEGAPTPAVAVIALPAGTVTLENGQVSGSPIYVLVHSSDTGECPTLQCVLYLTTSSSPEAKEMLQNAAASVLAAVEDESPPQILYQLYYEQMEGSSRLESDGLVLRLPGHSHSLSFDDSMLGPVQQAWKIIMGEAADEDTYMAFVDREAADEDNELYD